MEKTCSSCNETKDISEFYVHSAMKDGHLNKCKDCVRKRVKKHRAENIDKVREYDRSRGRTEKRKERNKKYHDMKVNQDPGYNKKLYEIKQKSRVKYKEKATARSRVACALYNGKIKRAECCQECGASGVELHAHHNDYSKPLEVRWLCTICHGLAHRKS